MRMLDFPLHYFHQEISVIETFHLMMVAGCLRDELEAPRVLTLDRFRTVWVDSFLIEGASVDVLQPMMVAGEGLDGMW